MMKEVSASPLIDTIFAENRKYKWTFVLADQTPSRVSENATRLTGSMLVMRLRDEPDRKLLGASALFTPEQFEHVARLNRGQGYFVTRGYYRPRLIHTVKLHERLDLSTPLRLSEIRPLIETESWYQETRVVYESAKLSRLNDELDLLAAKVASVARHIKQVMENLRGRHITATAAERAHGSFEALSESLRSFRYGALPRFIGEDRSYDPSELVAARKAIRLRFTSRVEPEAEKLLKALKALSHKAGGY
jgi:hypothetical protein